MLGELISLGLGLRLLRFMRVLDEGIGAIDHFSFFSPLLGNDSRRRFVALVMGAGGESVGYVRQCFYSPFRWWLTDGT